MKKVVLVLLVLGAILASAGVAHAVTSLNITATVNAALTITLSPTSLTFNTSAGSPSSLQNLTITTAGNNINYQLQLSCTTFTTTGGSQPPTVLQYRLQGTTPWVSATAIPTNMLPAARLATIAGDTRIFETRLNFPATAIPGTYAATVTITAIMM